MAIGMIDLVATALLHSRGMIVELNPVMKVFIERSEWLFAVVKGATLVAAFVTMQSYATRNRVFVQKAAYAGSFAYLFIWTTWFFGAR